MLFQCSPGTQFSAELQTCSFAQDCETSIVNFPAGAPAPPPGPEQISIQDEKPCHEFEVRLTI